MKKRSLYIVLFMLVAGVCFGGNGKKIGYTDANKAIMVKKSRPSFKIILQSNPTTGYSWFLKSYDADLIRPVKHKFNPPTGKKLTGVPGYEEWIFRVKPVGFIVPQITNILLIYTRPWEEQTVQPINFRVVTQNDN